MEKGGEGSVGERMKKTEIVDIKKDYSRVIAGLCKIEYGVNIYAYIYI